ncbi:MAG: hypothetical protein A2Y62_08165 [Candidatus Fischerbacteria bacterium RBG_13_37_8]|uniref:Glycosyl transferase family 28 C-terminal domain-containing protein n=1 Tax=Candidatus Fischerbacteria bacterium RBG_13_37_8 TaxID=1817863 RepID=A0A1F5V8D0_9BACT|nr:MAG: hypothetical protein A2Y62_08165 [Candidatus Fischerbacteria bacterium RBG_13_37_8]
MARKKVLFISGSIGLGHVIRDMAIANELRKITPGVDVFWLAAHPACMPLIEAGEKLLDESNLLADDNVPAEEARKQGYQLSLFKYLQKAKGVWEQNVKVFQQVISKEHYDVVVADEAYEIAMALGEKRIQMESCFVMIFDFFGLVAMNWNPMERLGTYLWNRQWAKTRDRYDGKQHVALFIGELEDIPDISLGFMLPNRRELAKQICKFVGYVFPFNPGDYVDRNEVRSKLGYGEEPLIICAVGGTSIGKELLELCIKAHPLVKLRVPHLRMVLVCGPRISPDTLQVPQGVEVKRYVPALYEHFAACDLAVVQAGGTATLELTALRRPFIYFPLEGHFEQEVFVAGRLARHQAGIKMKYSQTTPELLAETVINNIGTQSACAVIPTDGSRKAAMVISNLL